MEVQRQLRMVSSTFLNGGVGYVDARDRECGDRSGNALPRAPRLTGSVSLDLSREAGTGWLFLIPEVTYRGATYVDAANSELFRQQAHTLFNPRSGFERSEESRVGKESGSRC